MEPALIEGRLLRAAAVRLTSRAAGNAARRARARATVLCPQFRAADRRWPGSHRPAYRMSPAVTDVKEFPGRATRSRSTAVGTRSPTPCCRPDRRTSLWGRSKGHQSADAHRGLRGERRPDTCHSGRDSAVTALAGDLDLPCTHRRCLSLSHSTRRRDGCIRGDPEEADETSAGGGYLDRGRRDRG